ncbi:MAG: asparaginase domain-containing protein [Burkholderiaceae bacterium]
MTIPSFSEALTCGIVPPNAPDPKASMPQKTSPAAIALLTTGGTFEKVYLPGQGGLGFGQSRITDWKTRCRMPENTRLETVMLVDSLDMTEEERAYLCQRIRDCPENQVVVIHGTDTLVASALSADTTRRPEQVVVFTGAMVPASCEDSDALFNLGMAFAAAQCQPPGVWLACSGEIFDARGVEKNRTLGRFVRTTFQYKTD